MYACLGGGVQNQPTDWSLVTTTKSFGLRIYEGKKNGEAQAQPRPVGLVSSSAVLPVRCGADRRRRSVRREQEEKAPGRFVTGRSCVDLPRLGSGSCPSPRRGVTGEASVPVGSGSTSGVGGLADGGGTRARDADAGGQARRQAMKGHETNRAPSSCLLFVSSFFKKKLPRPAAFAHSFFHLDRPACSLRDHHLSPVANSWLRMCSEGTISPSLVGLARAIVLILGWRNWDGLAT